MKLIILYILAIVVINVTAYAQQPEIKPQIVHGSTIPVSERMFSRFLRVTGQLVGYHDALIAANAVGKVIEAAVERGTVVKSGDVLARLEEIQPRILLAEATAAVDLAKSRLALARNDQQRNQSLTKNKTIADADYQRLLTEVAAGEAELAAALARRDLTQKILDDCLIRTPFSGVVAERLVDPGVYVKADSPVVRVVDWSTLRLVLNVPETEVGALVIGQKVTFTTAAYLGRVFTGTLKFIGAVIREASRDLVVEALVENIDRKLRPGFFCDARIVLREEKSIAIPVSALRVEGTGRKVFIVEKNNTLAERLVEVGETHDGFIEIRRGVTLGEVVLDKPGIDMTDGLSFQLVK